MGNANSDLKHSRSLPNSPHIKRLGSPYKGQQVGGSSIPTPALGGRKPPSDHHAKNSTRSGGSIPQSGTQQLKGIPSASSSRSTSPANGTASFIPTPRSHGTRTNSVNEKHKSTNSSNGNRSSLRGPTSGTVNGAYLSAKQKDSMLDKFKIFNNKEKDNKSKNSGNNSGVSKRTSSSSGFSSARSERSDSSSTSLCSDVRPPPLPPHQNLPGSTTSSSSSEQASGYPDHSSSGKSPGLRGIRSRFSRTSKEGKESSPRSTRRSEERESSKGSPRSAHRAHRGGDSRDREREKGREKDGKVELKVQEGRKSDKLTLNLDTGSRCMSSASQVENSNRTSKLASISSSAKAVQQQRSPTMPQIPSPGSPLSSSGIGTGIPKPTAAVKGTTKPTPDKSSPSSPNVNSPSNTKEYHNKMARNSPAPPVRRTPIGGEAPPTPELRDPKGSLPRQRNLGRREDSNPPSVAMVSPMPVNNNNNNINNNNNNNQVPASESGSALSEMSQNSGHSNSNSSGGSSVIYKPSSEDENSMEKSFKKEIGDKMLKQDESEDVIIDVKPMQPLIRAAQYGYIRGLGGHNGRGLPPSLHVSRMALQENSHTVPQKGMRMTPPHLRRHIVPGSPRSPGQGHIIEADYSDLECIDLANGYMSDGDILRANMGCTTYPPPNMDGYLSEGGASLYAHRLNQRLKEGMRQVHESMTKAQHFMHDDSFDDSSSLSSGVSDTLNEFSEDLLSASLSSEQTTAIAKARGLKEVGLKLPVGLSGPSPRKATMGMDPSGAYKVVSSKAHVKKTESSQQTEGTPFKQISNTQWKKYVDNGKANVDIREYQRGLEINGSNSSRRIEQKKNNFGTTIMASPQAMVQSPVMVNPANGGSRKQERKGVGSEKRDKVLTSSPQINGESKKIQNPKTAPSNFGYKKINGSSSGSCTGKTVTSKTKESDPANSNNSRDGSSHSLDRPRTKLKVSGGTQTTSDLQYMPSTTGFHSDGEYSSNSLGRKYQQIKSYSLNGPAAAQLSQGVRERILQSPYRKVHIGPGGEYAPYGQNFYRERSPRIKGTDGSLSDNPYSNYAELQYGANPYGSPYSWVSRNNYAPSVASAPTRLYSN